MEKFPHTQVYGKNADDDGQKAAAPVTPEAALAAIPSLPTGKINENTVDCVNVSAMTVL